MRSVRRSRATIIMCEAPASIISTRMTTRTRTLTSMGRPRSSAMALDFSGKVVLVTGGGNGIGRACCRAFTDAGARVAVIDRDGAAAQQVAAELGGTASGHVLDVADGEAFAKLATDIAAAAAGIDALVNAAGPI